MVWKAQSGTLILVLALTMVALPDRSLAQSKTPTFETAQPAAAPPSSLPLLSVGTNSRTEGEQGTNTATILASTYGKLPAAIETQTSDMDQPVEIPARSTGNIDSGPATEQEPSSAASISQDDHDTEATLPEFTDYQNREPLDPLNHDTCIVEYFECLVNSGPDTENLKAPSESFRLLHEESLKLYERLEGLAELIRELFQLRTELMIELEKATDARVGELLTRLLLIDKDIETLSLRSAEAQLNYDNSLKRLAEYLRSILQLPDPAHSCKDALAACEYHADRDESDESNRR